MNRKLLFCALVVCQTISPAMAAPTNQQPRPDEQLIRMSAEQSGISYEEELAWTIFRENFDRYVEDLHKRYPDQITVSWTSPGPDLNGYIRFKGAIPEEVRERVEDYEFFGFRHIQLFDNGRWLEPEFVKRQRHVESVLRSENLKGYSVAYDHVSNTIKVILDGTSETMPSEGEDREAYVNNLMVLMKADKIKDVTIIVEDKNPPRGILM